MCTAGLVKGPLSYLRNRYTPRLNKPAVSTRPVLAGVTQPGFWLTGMRRRALSPPGFSLRSLHAAITWRGVGDKRIEKLMHGALNLVHGMVECAVICFGRLGESTELANELQ